ncbi:DUF6059 family protein [Streptomyces sp. NPDC051172]|uniref:DUF6059 family protein n=1 Tax=Streptomyces sp. NPDC051172 TaxID=3155796 RepID=UPI00343AA392
MSRAGELLEALGRALALSATAMGHMWIAPNAPFHLMSERRRVPAPVPAGPRRRPRALTGPAAGHPERLVPDFPLSTEERRLTEELGWTRP